MIRFLLYASLSLCLLFATATTVAAEICEPTSHCGPTPLCGPRPSPMNLSSLLVPDPRPLPTGSRIPCTICTQVGLACDCPADLSGDDTVDATDLAVLLAAWGPGDCAPPVSCDFDGDGSIGCYDLEYLLGNHGSCPSFGDVDGSGGKADCEDVWAIEAAAQQGRDCRADLNRNGVIDSGDADALNCLWGPTSSGLGDLNADDVVDSADLAILLATPDRDCRADLNRDGCVNWSDREPLDPPDRLEPVGTRSCCATEVKTSCIPDCNF